MPAKQPFYITTAISYPNGPPHIGHAYEAIATDAIARFMRLDGYDVYFLTGTDEHGQKMQQTAAREGLTARQLRDRNVPRVRGHGASGSTARTTTSSTPPRSATTAPRRRSGSAMEKNGDIYLDKYAGWYSVRDEAYYAEDETHLNEHGKARRDQDRHAGRVGGGGELFLPALGLSPTNCSSFTRRPDYVLPKERLNEVASFVRGGLQDLSISRTTFDWGVKVPGNDKHIMYVWVDALTNYITGVGYPDTDERKVQALLAGGAARHRQGHRALPRGLLAGVSDVGRASRCRKRIFSHGFLFNRGEKMSKSVGNVVDPFTLADAYGVDPLRYFFLREMPFGQDGNYSHEAIVNRINADLANDLGNLAQRSLSMIGKALRRQVAGAGRIHRRRQGHSWPRPTP